MSAGEGSAVIQAGLWGGQAAVLEQDEICTAPITSALEGRRVDNWVEGRGRGKNRRQAITGPN